MSVREQESVGCDHIWARRRDGRICALCGEFRGGDYMERDEAMAQQAKYDAHMHNVLTRKATENR